MANTYQLIASTVLGSDAADVIFSSIPQTYTDLVLTYSARNTDFTTVASQNIRLNNDTGTNYSQTSLVNAGTTISPINEANTGPLQPGYLTPGQTAGSFGLGEFYFPNYTSTAAKPFLVLGTSIYNTTNPGTSSQISALYRGSSGISIIRFAPFDSPSKNWTSGSCFYLYGIKNS
jgi:hypothetical protein